MKLGVPTRAAAARESRKDVGIQKTRRPIGVSTARGSQKDTMTIQVSIKLGVPVRATTARESWIDTSRNSIVLQGRCPYRLAPASGVNPAQSLNADAPTGRCLPTGLTLHSNWMKSGSSLKAFFIIDMIKRENKKQHRTNFWMTAARAAQKHRLDGSILGGRNAQQKLI